MPRRQQHQAVIKFASAAAGLLQPPAAGDGNEASTSGRCLSGSSPELRFCTVDVAQRPEGAWHVSKFCWASMTMSVGAAAAAATSGLAGRPQALFSLAA